jgi:hypothetical protein
LGKPLNALDISHCTVGFLQSAAKDWGENLVLDGFVYGSLRDVDWQTSDYLAWLKKQQPAEYGTKEQSRYLSRSLGSN